MIKEQDLLEAIAECQGERNPDAKTCIKLAAYYTILNNIKPQETRNKLEGYSQKAPAEQVRYDSGSEFSEAIKYRDTIDIFGIMDELMETLRILSPRLYRATVDKIRG